MTEQRDWFSRPELVEIAHRQGYAWLTFDQVERWHKHDVLPRPARVHVGGGTESHYPLGTNDQLLVLCRWHEKHRKLRELRFALWWEGWPVGDVRTQLEGLATPPKEVVSVRRGTDQFFRRIDDWVINELERLSRGRRDNDARLMARIRRRLNALAKTLDGIPEESAPFEAVAGQESSAG